MSNLASQPVSKPAKRSKKKSSSRRISSQREATKSALLTLTKRSRGAYKSYDIDVVAKILHTYYFEIADWQKKKNDYPGKPTVEYWLEQTFGSDQSNWTVSLSFMRKMCSTVNHYKDIGFTKTNEFKPFPWDLPIFVDFVTEYKNNNLIFKSGKKKTVSDKLSASNVSLDDVKEPIKMGRHCQLLPVHVDAQSSASPPSSPPSPLSQAAMTSNVSGRNVTLNTATSNRYLTPNESAALCAWVIREIDTSKTKTIGVDTIRKEARDMLLHRNVELLTKDKLPGKKWLASFLWKWKDELKTVGKGMLHISY